MTDTCTFCRVNIGSRRSAPLSPSHTSFTPRSRRAQPRPRITPPSSPTLLSPPARPRRVRTRPRHFDSSPDLDIPRRCEKANHVPLKAAHDFIDAGGRMHPICNECRESIQHRRRSSAISNGSSSESENQPLPSQNNQNQGDDHPSESPMHHRFTMIPILILMARDDEQRLRRPSISTVSSSDSEGQLLPLQNSQNQRDNPRPELAMHRRFTMIFY